MALAGRFESAVIRSAREARLPDTDQAGVLLARRYARAIDRSDEDPDLLSDLGPKLEKVLTSLGLTQAGRGVVKGKPGEVNGDEKAPATVLQLLRTQHRAN